MNPIPIACLSALFLLPVAPAVSLAGPDTAAADAAAAPAPAQPSSQNADLPTQAAGEAQQAADADGGSAAASEADRLVARVGGEPIRLKDLLDWVRVNPYTYSTFGAQWARNAVLHQVIKKRLLSQAARDAFADDPQARDLSEQARNARYIKQHLTPSKTVTEDELRAFYAANEARFGIPPTVRIRELFFPKPRIGASDDPGSVAQAVHEKLKNGAAVADFAEAHPADEVSQQRGGDRGFLSIIERPQLGELTKDMAIGAISDPVELDTGYSIVQLLERRSGVPAPFEAARADVERALIAEREGDMIAEFLTVQARERGIEILLPEYADAWPGASAAPAAKDVTD